MLIFSSDPDFIEDMRLKIPGSLTPIEYLKELGKDVPAEHATASVRRARSLNKEHKVDEHTMNATVASLKQVVAFDTSFFVSPKNVKRQPNDDYVRWMRQRIETLMHDKHIPRDMYEIIEKEGIDKEDGSKQKVLGVRLGKKHNGGVLFCGATDVPMMDDRSSNPF